MNKKIFGVILILSFMVLTTATVAYSYPRYQNSNSILHTNFIPTENQLNRAKNEVLKSFPNDTRNLHLRKSIQFMLESENAQFGIDPATLSINSVRYNNVNTIGKKKKISQEYAHAEAIDFIKKHFPELDINKFVEESAFHSNYILHLTEINKATGTKLLNNITVIINQETGKIALALFDLSYPETLSPLSINKANAEQIADNKMNSIFSNAKLVSSSPTPEQKLLNGKVVVGWIFMYKSNKHSAGIMIDGNTGKVIVQQKY